MKPVPSQRVVPSASPSLHGPMTSPLGGLVGFGAAEAPARRARMKRERMTMVKGLMIWMGSISRNGECYWSRPGGLYTDDDPGIVSL